MILLSYEKDANNMLDKSQKFLKIVDTGELAERFKAPSWKGGVVQASVGSNPMFSASV